MILVLAIGIIFAFSAFCQTPVAEQFRQAGFIEISDRRQEEEQFASLYARFDAFIELLQSHPIWAQKLYIAKERFIRSKDRNYYSTDYFGFYDESKRAGKNQISFYYSPHFHDFICSRYPELSQIPEIDDFLALCLEIQKPYEHVFSEVAAELGLETVFSSDCGHPPILFKVVKYLSSYTASRPHYDGSVFSLFLHSTDNQSLLLSPYKRPLAVDDFYSPLRYCRRSILLIPGTLLPEFSIYPTPHIVLQSGKVRYAAIAFAMRPNYISPKTEYVVLPLFH